MRGGYRHGDTALRRAKSARTSGLQVGVYTQSDFNPQSRGRPAPQPGRPGCTRSMRFLAAAVVLLVALVTPPAACLADGPRLHWPLRPAPATVTREFDAPAQNWLRGHRGVDLAGLPGQTVYAAGAGVVVFAGPLAGRPVVSVDHAGGLRTSYEPVRASVTPGQQVGPGSPLGLLAPGHPGCPVAACLHWGAMWGPAQRADYVDPLGLLATTPVRLKPLAG